MERKRYAGIDRLRGWILISMILYHITWDMVYLFGAEWEWFRTGLARAWQQSICWSFILLSGFCWHFGRNKWKRGCVVFAAGVVVSVVTALFMPEGIILFGVLTLLGSCMLLLVPLDKVLQRIPSVVGMIVSAMLFAVTRNVNQGYLGFEGWNWVALPKVLYANWITTYIGFMKQGFYSADYFSLIPWLFLYVAGYYMYAVFEKRDWIRWFDVRPCRWLVWLEWLGKHSLVIYMVHQPVVYGILLLIM